MKHTSSFFQALSIADKLSFIGLMISILSLLIGFLNYVFPLSTALEPTVFCPALLSQAKIKDWTQVGQTDDSSISKYIDEFNQIRGASGGFYEGDVLPRDIYIITAFGNLGDTLIYQSYPVKPIVNYKSYGVFRTTKVFKVTFQGACMKSSGPAFNTYITISTLMVLVFALFLFIPKPPLFKKLFPLISNRTNQNKV